MSALEQEIMEKFHQLDKDAKQRVKALIEQDTVSSSAQSSKPDFDYEAWFADVEKLRQQITDSHGGVFPAIDVVSMLREIRDGEDE